MKLAPLCRLTLLSVAFLLGACATPPAPAPAASGVASRDPCAGKWAGTWRSVSGHHGKLECTLSRVDRTHYRAHFTAYWLALHGSYDILLETKRHASSLQVQGEKDLGKLYGGLYHYTGTIAPGVFHADYTATSDRGVFELHRLP